MARIRFHYNACAEHTLWAVWSNDYKQISVGTEQLFSYFWDIHPIRWRHLGRIIYELKLTTLNFTRRTEHKHSYRPKQCVGFQLKVWKNRVHTLTGAVRLTIIRNVAAAVATAHVATSFVASHSSKGRVLRVRLDGECACVLLVAVRDDRIACARLENRIDNMRCTTNWMWVCRYVGTWNTLPEHATSKPHRKSINRSLWARHEELLTKSLPPLTTTTTKSSPSSSWSPFA